MNGNGIDWSRFATEFGPTKRRSLLRWPLRIALTVVLFASLSSAVLLVGRAQEATPPPAAMVQHLGSAEPSGAPGKVLVLNRVTFPAGAAIPLHTHPGATLVVVESGAFEITVMHGNSTVTRATVDGTPGPVEQLEPGVAAILGPGDAFFEDAGAMHTARNAADGETVVLVSQLLEAGQPATIPVTATPTS